MVTMCATGSTADSALATRTESRKHSRASPKSRSFFVQAGVICLNSFITPKESLRQLARGIIGEENLLEIYVECSFETP